MLNGAHNAGTRKAGTIVPSISPSPPPPSGPPLKAVGSSQRQQQPEEDSATTAILVDDDARRTSIMKGSDAAACPFASFPTNYVWNIEDGYRGTTLHAISPQLAELAYPYLATIKTEAFVVTVLFLSAGISILPIISGYFDPANRILYRISYLLYIPALQRVCLIDLRLLRLLLRQFDTWYLLGSCAIMLGAAAHEAFTEVGVVYAYNMIIAGSSTVILDCIRTPFDITLWTAIIYTNVTLFWSIFLWFEGGSGRSLFYDTVWFGSVDRAGCIMGRMVAIFFYFIRFSTTLWLRPGSYVVLHRPLLVQDREMILRARAAVAPHSQEGAGAKEGCSHSSIGTRGGGTSTVTAAEGGMAKGARAKSYLLHETYASSSSSSTTTTTTNNNNNNNTANNNNNNVDEHLLLQRLWPRLASVLYSLLSSPSTEVCLLVVWMAAAVLSTLPIITTAPLLLPTSWCYLSFLLYLPCLHRLAFLDLRVAALLTRQFDTMILCGNLVFGLASVPCGLFNKRATMLWGVNVLLSSLPMVLLDALRIPARVKLHTAACYSLLFLLLTLCNAIIPSPVMDHEATLVSRITVASFVMGRLLTLGLYYTKYSANLLFRPDMFLILREPLMRHDRNHLLVSTLRDAFKGTPLTTRGGGGGDGGDTCTMG